MLVLRRIVSLGLVCLVAIVAFALEAGGLQSVTSRSDSQAIASRYPLRVRTPSLFERSKGTAAASTSRQRV